MTTFAIIGWLLAAGLGVGWWIEHRGIAGVKSDLVNAKKEIETRVRK